MSLDVTKPNNDPEARPRRGSGMSPATRLALLALAGGFVFAASTPPTDVQPGILVGLIALAYALMAPLPASSLPVGSPPADSGAPQSAPSSKLAGTTERPSSRFAGTTERAKAVRAGAWRGFLFGIAANLFALRFVPDVMARFTSLPAIAGWVALLLLSAAQALPWAVSGAVARWLMTPGATRAPNANRLRVPSRPATPAWLAFGSSVYLATFLPAVFPWTPAGGLARWPVLLQTAELVGERGTSFLVALGCGLLAEAFVRVRRLRGAQVSYVARPFAAAVAVFVTLVIYGMVRTGAVDAARADAPHARVAALQPDFDAMFRWDDRHASDMMDRLSALTRRAEQAGAILTVWPESAYPYTLAHGTRTSPRGARAVLQQGVHGPVLTGAYLSRGGGLGTNSAILVRDGDIEPSYDKRHLLWFGETVPLADTFPVLRRVFARGTGLTPGTESVAFRVGPIVAAVLNCYEDTLPAAGREAMSVRPNLLINVTNDAWFAGSAEGELHLRLAVLRAVETRRDLIRAVNRGPTTWVDATGRIRMRREAAPGLGPSPPLIADVALLEQLTLYARAGDAPLIVLVTLALLLPWARRGRRRSREERVVSDP